MTNLSINLNKIALLRNSRGRDYPNILDFAQKFISLGVKGITIHPRQDERHITMQDAIDLGNFLKSNNGVELNIEGYPSEEFLRLVESIKPDQCTLVPDSPDQLTSDHGWDLNSDLEFVTASISRLKKLEIRTAIFMDPDSEQIKRVPLTKADRIELYTESYAANFQNAKNESTLNKFKDCALLAQQLGVEVNAGHDLDLTNLPQFLEIQGILEVSIGHALVIECIELGMTKVIAEYLKVCS